MSTIALSNKAAKLMKLCDAEGFQNLDNLLAASAVGSVCPAICMTEGCDYPSGSPARAARVPINPPPPGRFSTMTCCPHTVG
jgi:hypothetical protein